MKTQLLLLLFSFFVTTTCVTAQSGVFNKIFVQTSNDRVNDIPNDIAANAGYYYYALGKGMYSGCAPQGLYKIDTTGQIIWYNNCHITVDSLPDNYPMGFSPPYLFDEGSVLSIDFDADSNIIICGVAAYEDDYGPQYNFLQKLNHNDGSVIWSFLRPITFPYLNVFVGASGLIYVGGESSYGVGTDVYTTNGEFLRTFPHKVACKAINGDVVLNNNTNNLIFLEVNDNGDIIQQITLTGITENIYKGIDNVYIARLQNKLTLLNSAFQIITQSGSSINQIYSLETADDGYYILFNNAPTNVYHYSPELTLNNIIQFNGIMQGDYRSIIGLAVTNNYLGIAGRERIIQQNQSNAFLATSQKTTNPPTPSLDAGVFQMNIQIDSFTYTSSYSPPPILGYSFYVNSNITLHFTIKNYGNEVINDLYVYYKLPGGVNCALNIYKVYLDDIALQPGATYTFTRNHFVVTQTFMPSFDPSNLTSMINVCAWTSAPDLTTDADMSNNIYCSTVVSTPEIFQNANVVVYPNPSSEEILISYPFNTFNFITIYDYTGNLVLNQSIAMNSSKFQLNNLSSGYYKVVLWGKEEVVHKSFVIIK
jgi:hypothetical protein